MHIDPRASSSSVSAAVRSHLLHAQLKHIAKGKKSEQVWLVLALKCVPKATNNLYYTMLTMAFSELVRKHTTIIKYVLNKQVCCNAAKQKQNMDCISSKLVSTPQYPLRHTQILVDLLPLHTRLNKDGQTKTNIKRPLWNVVPPV